MEEVELVAVQRSLYGIDDNIDRIIRALLGYLIALAYGSPVALLEVRWSPGGVEVMNGHGSLLGVNASAEHRC